MAIPPDEFFGKQEKELAKYTERRVRDLLRILELARKELYVVIAGAEVLDNIRRVVTVIDQINSVTVQLRRDVMALGSSAEELGQMVERHLAESIAYDGGPKVLFSGRELNLDTLRRFSLAELDHVTKLTDAEIQTVKSLLYTKVGVKGQNPAQVARELVGKDSRFRGKYGHIETIMRTETSQVYNAQSLDGIKHANETYGLKLNKKVVETIDAERNHPISQVINGQVQPVDKPFKARVSAVKRKAEQLKKGSGGVFWAVKDGFYVGQRLPAHYRERGIIVPTDEVPTVIKM